MSDFFHDGWSWYVAAATALGLGLCLLLLVIASKRTVMADDNTTGHVFDEDLRELNNPLPRWWMWLFIATVVFSAIYLALYPGMGSMPGTLKWSSTTQYQAEQDKARAEMASVYARFAGMAPEAIAQDAVAMGIGERLFLNNCAQCHGSDARGSKGFPDLTDTDWLGAGTPEYIVKTITEGRSGTMPPMAAALGTAEDVKNVAHHVLSLSGSPHNNVAAQLGRSKFGACAACHGADGKGNTALGAPNLTDKVWLYGWGEAAIVEAITKGRHGQMPAQARLLTPEQIQVLGAYVWKLSNGGAPTATGAAPGPATQTAKASQ
jgi:cytochrome c oxidase cbb3-type subunit 3